MKRWPLWAAGGLALLLVGAALFATRFLPAGRPVGERLPTAAPTTDQSSSPGGSAGASPQASGSPSGGSSFPRSGFGPAPRSGAGFAFDPINKVALLFGGVGGDGVSPLGDTWEWDGRAWSNPHPISAPLPRSFAAITADGASDSVLLFGGGSPNVDPARNDTWAWDGRSWARQPAAAAPPTLLHARAAYDDSLQSVILFGTDPAGDQPQTWRWNGTTWTLEAGAQPPFRFDAAMTYDAVHRQVLLFGGAQSATGKLRDTWVLNGTGWVEVSPPISPPGGPASAAFDAKIGQVVLFTAGGETWTWDGGNWIEQHAGRSPAPRIYASIVDDPGSGEILLFGGRSPDTNAALSDLWAWTGADWERRW